MKWESYITGIMVLLLLIFSYPYVNTELQGANFTDSTLGLATSKIVPLIYIISIIVMSVLMLIMVVKDMTKG